MEIAAGDLNLITYDQNGHIYINNRILSRFGHIDVQLPTWNKSPYLGKLRLVFKHAETVAILRNGQLNVTKKKLVLITLVS